MTTKFQQLQNNAHFYSIQNSKTPLNPASAYFFFSILLAAVLGAGLLLPTGTFISIGFPISPKQRGLCVVGLLGRRKKKCARDDGKGKERKRLFPLLIIPRALAIF